MRGKQAAKAANRRASAESARVAELEAALRQQRSDHDSAVEKLRIEIARLKAEHSREAGSLAGREVNRLAAKAKDHQRMKGVADDIAMNAMIKMDRFAYNACRYISMTEGVRPYQALALVMTWMLDDDFVGVINSTTLLVKCGLPPHGWVARELERDGYFRRACAKRRLKDDAPLAFSLDRAEDEGFKTIHPNYMSSWYPRMEYGGIEIEPEAADSDQVAG